MRMRINCNKYACHECPVLLLKPSLTSTIRIDKLRYQSTHGHSFISVPSILPLLETFYEAMVELACGLPRRGLACHGGGGGPQQLPRLR